MHDSKLLGDHGLEGQITARDSSTVARSAGRAPSRNHFWAIVGFCVVGLIGSLFVPASYLHTEQTSAVAAEAPLS
jgi:hypothetical protein